MMTEGQVEWKTYRGSFLGLAEPQKKGLKKDNTEWVRNKLSMSHAEGKVVSFGTFQDITGMQMNQLYTILFKEDEIQLQSGGTGKTKTAVKIEPHTGDKPLGFEMPQQQPTAPAQAQAGSSSTPLPALKFDVTKFANQFRDSDKIDMADKTLDKFIAVFVKSTNKQQFTDLEVLFNTVVHPVVDEQKEPDFS